MNNINKPVLLIGGSGVVGKWVTRHLRSLLPDLPIVIGGRNLNKAEEIANEIGNASAVTIDLTREDLGLTHEQFSSIGVFFRDKTFNIQKFAQNKHIPFVAITGSIPVMGEDMATYVYGPQASPVVFASHWMAGISIILAIEDAKKFKTIDNISMVANYDMADEGGVTMEEMEDLFPSSLAPMVVKDGIWKWELAQEAAEGVEQELPATSVVDILSLGLATEAKAARFVLTYDDSPGTKAGNSASHTVTTELRGEKADGTSTTIRREIEAPQGQAYLVGLGAAIVMEQLLVQKLKPGVYFPEKFITAEIIETRLKEYGVEFK
ncbi:hypothetical protein HF638_06335 [Paenibacillus sp. SZ31]|uniref:hypothetical protein n=1 Tax=Paenibacillus sp. SZ31 TaxID=2725555 RepID=UPI00146F3152|nr:hypothetical protein [Paenibacillus sp. SZ31]NMI03587.1 hypothetical protein [Paenibacillus sp. SZ31]